MVQVRLVTLHTCRNDHSFDRLRIALHQVQKLLPYDFTKSNIQVLPFRRSLYGTGTRILLEMAPYSVHLQLGLKDKRRASQRLFKNNVLSFLLEITVAPLAYVIAGYKCTRCTQKPPFECKKTELCHIILMRITSWASPPPLRAWCNPTGSRTVSSCTNQNILKHSNHRDF